VKKYKFILKPLFFIFSLLFTSWMVLKIEQLSPSDFGKYRSLFKTVSDTTIIYPKKEIRSSVKKTKLFHKQYLKNLCIDYKTGVIDSEKLDRQLELFLDNFEK
jgi:hypothetical protein